MTERQEYDLQCSTLPSVTIYSDGSSKPKLNTGGYGVIMTCNGHSKFYYGGFVNCSNNSMELLGPITALRDLNCTCRVNIISDSRYVVDGINMYLKTWAANGWRRTNGGCIANVELWREMWTMCQRHIVVATWVRGHDGDLGNQLCDHFACIAAYNAAGVPVPPELIAANRL